MSIWQHWQTQKEGLRASLTEQTPSADAAAKVRRALLQTEQNALAEMDDDLLRQQASVLMGGLKGSLGLMEAHGTAQVWVAQKSTPVPAAVPMLEKAAAGLLVLAAVWCGFRDEWLALALCVSGLITGAAALLSARKAAPETLPADRVQASVTLDVDRLIAVLDSQLRAMDRYISDFASLNEQAAGCAEHADSITLSRAADLMEALYDCGEEAREPAEEAARRLLERLGLEALDYTEDNSRLFNALPSKSHTRTLSPAIVSLGDQQLLRRGTAAVRIGAA